MKDDLGDRMKQYEQAEAGRRLMPLLPVMARIDGRSFSKFTKGMARPFDERMSNAMIGAATDLATETGASMVYTQSDEISLAWLQESHESELFFGGKVQKLTSVLASIATASFAEAYRKYFPSEERPHAHFDCRVWNVPSIEEGANTFLWRALDAEKNSVSMLARCHFSQKQLHGLGRSDMKKMLREKGVEWESYPEFFTRGTWLQKRTEVRKFTAAELSLLPPKHEARQNPDLEVERGVIVKVNMPPFVKVTNRAGVVFRGEEPRT
jgi:tRNA(His) 5'-end guanylyltransferase